jgi:DNA repair exonuclease SbcCD nuclease subunit
MTSEQIRLGVITEVHIVPPGTPEGRWHNPFLFDQAEQLFSQAVQRCEELGVDAIAILGDLTHFADPGSFAGVRRVLETTALPVYVLPGNHDLAKDAQPLGAFQQALDLPNVTIAPATLPLSPGIEVSLVGLEPGGGDWGYTGVVPQAATGAEPTLHLVLTHFPTFAMKELLAAADLKHAGDLTNRDAMLEAIEAIPGPVLIVNGHLHVHAAIDAGRILQLSVAALIEPPHDVTLLTVGIDDAGAPWVSRQATGLVETPDVTLPVLSSREERWRIVDGVWQSIG